MITRAMLAAALLLAAFSVRAEPPKSDSDWACRSGVEPKTCANNARELAKQHVGHAEGLRAYALACVGLIDKAVADKEKKVADAHAAMTNLEKAKKAAGITKKDHSQEMLDEADAELAQARKHRQDADAIVNDTIKARLGKLRSAQDELDKTDFQPDPDGDGPNQALHFNADVSKKIVELEKTDDALGRDLRGVVREQKAADPSNDCDPALKDPYY